MQTKLRCAVFYEYDIFVPDGRNDSMQVCLSIWRMRETHHTFVNEALRFEFVDTEKCRHIILHFFSSYYQNCLELLAHGKAHFF